MPLDMGLDAGQARRRRMGKTNYLAGLAAEDSVVRELETRGLKVVLRRWRGKRGEIDIVARDGSCFVFVEVKKARSHEEAAQRLGWAQQQRLYATGEEFLALTPRGTLSDVRFDLALVDQMGRVEILENVLMAA